MSEQQNMTVTIKASVEAFNKALADLSYSFACTHLSMLRRSRALWPHLPLWKRIWLTYQRKGW